MTLPPFCFTSFNRASYRVVLSENATNTRAEIQIELKSSATACPSHWKEEETMQSMELPQQAHVIQANSNLLISDLPECETPLIYDWDSS